jgi:hypothetical protein
VGQIHALLAPQPAPDCGQAEPARQQRFDEAPMGDAAKARRRSQVIFPPHWINIIHRQ